MSSPFKRLSDPPQSVVVPPLAMNDNEFIIIPRFESYRSIQKFNVQSNVWSSVIVCGPITSYKLRNTIFGVAIVDNGTVYAFGDAYDRDDQIAYGVMVEVNLKEHRMHSLD